MPRTRREMVERRYHQVNHKLLLCQRQLAEVAQTYLRERPEFAPGILARMGDLDRIRDQLMRHKCQTIGGTAWGFDQEEDSGTILKAASPITSYKAPQ